jgi:hypothetical protein
MSVSERVLVKYKRIINIMNILIVILKFIFLISALTIAPYYLFKGITAGIRFVNDERFEYRFTLLKNLVLTEGINKKNYLKVKLEFDTFETEMDRVTSLAQIFQLRFKKYIKPVDLIDIHQLRIENSIKKFVNDITIIEEQKLKATNRKERIKFEERQYEIEDDIELLKTLL